MLAITDKLLKKENFFELSIRKQDTYATTFGYP
jgi:hypothetical protein